MTIVAPVSRHRSVADIDRSLTFYRDVLGLKCAPPRSGALSLHSNPI